MGARDSRDDVLDTDLCNVEFPSEWTASVRFCSEIGEGVSDVASKLFCCKVEMPNFAIACDNFCSRVGMEGSMSAPKLVVCGIGILKFGIACVRFCSRVGKEGFADGVSELFFNLCMRELLELWSICA